jgi:transcriptional regulator with XRE-family HTH domain
VREQASSGRAFLSEWRQSQNLTQPQVAALAGMSVSNLSQLENGRQNYTQKTLQALASVYRCHPADLLHKPPGWPKEKPQ